MANKIIPKRSSVSGKVPATTDLDVGEIAVNLTDRKIYTKDSGGTVVSIGGGSGDVIGPASSMNSALALFNGTTGKLLKNSQIYADANGNVGQLNANPSQYKTSGTTNNVTGTGTNSGPATQMLVGDVNNPGNGYLCRESFRIQVGGKTEISRITATGVNGAGYYFKIICVGHSASTGSGLRILEGYWWGDAASLSFITNSSYGAAPLVYVECPSNGVLIVSAESANQAAGNLNAGMSIEWLVAPDFSGATNTIS